LTRGWTRYVGFAITIAFVGVLLWRVNLSQMTAALATANYAWAAPIFLTTLASYTLRAARWRQILRPARSLALTIVFPVMLIGFMANNLLPARMGEVIRAYTLGRKTGLSKSMGLATILLERVFDGLTLVATLGLVALLFPLPDWGREVGYISAALFAGATVAALFVLAREDLALRLLAAALRPLPRRLAERAHGIAQSFIVGLDVLRRGRDVAVVTGWSAVIWSVETLSYYLAIRSVNPRLPLGSPLVAALLLMVMVNLGTLIPAAPGYVGTFQFFGILALSAFGIAQGVALAIVLIAYAVQWLTVTGIGLICVARESITLGSLTQAGAVDGTPKASSG
jgi:uncharacterized protein (TIRG00374 family)